MNYTDLTTKLSEIITKIKSKDNTSVDSFDIFLDEVKVIPSFSSQNIWDLGWRMKVWEFGALFSSEYKADASRYIYKLNEKKWEENEALAFIYSEIVWNFFWQSEAFKRDTFKGLIKKYLGNPEFYHTYGHYLLGTKEFEQAVLNYKKAVDLEPSNDNYISSLFGTWAEHFSSLITKGKLDEADKLRTEMLAFFTDGAGARFWVFKNVVVSMKDRIADHALIREKIDGINDLISKRIDGIRSHLINIVSLITAVIGYLLIGTNVVLSARTIKESFLMMFGLGIIMIVFVTSISYILRSNFKEKFWAFLSHRRFWAIVVLLTVLLITYYKL